MEEIDWKNGINVKSALLVLPETLSHINYVSKMYIHTTKKAILVVYIIYLHGMPFMPIYYYPHHHHHQRGHYHHGFFHQNTFARLFSLAFLPYTKHTHHRCCCSTREIFSFAWAKNMHACFIIIIIIAVIRIRIAFSLLLCANVCVQIHTNLPIHTHVVAIRTYFVYHCEILACHVFSLSFFPHFFYIWPKLICMEWMGR